MKYLQLFYDGLDTFEYLSDEEAGKLIKSIINYNKGKISELEGSLNALLVMFKNEIDRTKKEYETKCFKNKANGSLGGRPKTQNNRTVKKITQITQDKDKDKDKYIYIDFINKFSFVDEHSFNKMIKHLNTKYSPLTKVRISNNIKKLKENPNLFSLAVDEMVRLDFNGLFVPSNPSNNNFTNLDEITKVNLIKNPELGGYN